MKARRILVVLCILAVIVPVIGHLASSSQAAEHSLSIDSAAVEPGSSVDIDVSAVAPSLGIGAYAIDVFYDQSIVTATSCTTHPPLSVCNEDFGSNTVRFTGASDSGLFGTVNIGSITFRVGLAEGDSLLHPQVDTLVDVDGNDLTDGLVVTDGAITVSLTPPTEPPPIPSATPPPAPTVIPPSLPPTDGTPAAGTPAAVASPTRGGEVQGRDLTIDYKKTVPFGEQALIGVTVSLPDALVLAPDVAGYSRKVVAAPDGESLQIYFKPPNPTLLTLKVSALNFVTEYSPTEIQEIFSETPSVDWLVTMTPKSGVSGRQDVTLTLTQQLPEGGRVPPDVKGTYSSVFSILVSAPGGSRLDSVLDILKWALPGGLTPLITAAIGFLNRRRIRAFLTRLRDRS